MRKCSNRKLWLSLRPPNHLPHLHNFRPCDIAIAKVFHQISISPTWQILTHQHILGFRKKTSSISHSGFVQRNFTPSHQPLLSFFSNLHHSKSTPTSHLLSTQSYLIVLEIGQFREDIDGRMKEKMLIDQAKWILNEE